MSTPKNPCAICDGPEDEREKRLAAYREWERTSIEKYGFFIHFVPDGMPHGLINIHTHGFVESFGFPDIQIVIHIGQNAAMGILHLLADKCRAAKGGEQPFKVGVDYNNIAEGFLVRFIDAKENDRPVLRLIVPDNEGNLDADKMNRPLFAAQYQHLDS
jgi:hypothetical protein